MSDRAQRAFLDRPIARGIALLCAVGSLALLGYIHRDELLPGPASDVASDEPFRRCFSERAEDIERMREEGVLNDSQVELFRSRAEAFCRTQTADKDQILPGLPPLPPQ